jgi:hypothetical protein
MGVVPTFLTKCPHPAENDFTGIIVNVNGGRFENGQAVYGLTDAGNIALIFTCLRPFDTLSPVSTTFKTGQGTLRNISLETPILCSPDQTTSNRRRQLACL